MMKRKIDLSKLKKKLMSLKVKLRFFSQNSLQKAILDLFTLKNRLKSQFYDN